MPILNDGPIQSWKDLVWAWQEAPFIRAVRLAIQTLVGNCEDGEEVKLCHLGKSEKSGKTVNHDLWVTRSDLEERVRDVQGKPVELDEGEGLADFSDMDALIRQFSIGLRHVRVAAERLETVRILRCILMTSNGAFNNQRRGEKIISAGENFDTTLLADGGIMFSRHYGESRTQKLASLPAEITTSQVEEFHVGFDDVRRFKERSDAFRPSA